MRLAIVLAEADPAVVTGAENVPELTVPAARLSTALAAAGHDVTVYTADADAKGAREAVSAQGYRVMRLPGGPAAGTSQSDLGTFTDHLEQAWQRDRPDVVHAQSWLSGMACQSAGRSQRIPVVQSFGVVTPTGGHTAGTEAGDVRKLVSVLARRASWVAAANTEELFELLKMGCSRSRISVIPCGVDSEVFTPPGPATQRRGMPYRIVSIWTSTSEFDLETAVAGLTGLPDTELVIAADPAAAAEVRARLGPLTGSAEVAGRVAVEEVRNPTELAALLRSADVYASVAVTESTGAGALMAMSCGVPVIASEVGALTDIVVDEVTGRMVPVGDVARFTETTRRLLHEPFAGRGMGAAGRDRARSRYSWERVAADAVRAYTGAAHAAGVVSA